ncbi:Peptide chain release factor 2 [compost metagenome]
MNNVIYLQLSSGRGPAECCRVVALLIPMIMRRAEQLNLEISVVNKEPGDINGTFHSALLMIKGDAINTLATEWEGTIQWIAQSPYRKFHKRKNWFVSIKSFQPTKKEISEKGIEYKACRASGPGGQNVNKVETAVRATHIASGISVLTSDTRSQLQNKKLATERLQVKLFSWHLEKQMQAIQQQWEQHTNLQRGGAVKVIKEKL